VNKRLAALGLAACLAAGCTRIDLGWRLAPSWLRHEGGLLLGIGADEQAGLDKDIRDFMHGLALRFAPRAAAWSRHLGALVAQGKDQAAVDCLFDEGTRLWRSMLEPGIAPLAACMARRPQQRAQALAKAFNEKARQDLGRAPGSKEYADWTKRLKGALNDWIGALNPAQKARVGAFLAHSDYPAACLAQDRRRREQKLLAILKPGVSEQAVEAELRLWWMQPETDRDQDCQQALQDYRLKLRSMLVKLLASLSQHQREELAGRLAKAAQDLDAIYRQAVVSASP
jgi:hypothetical protein